MEYNTVVRKRLSVKSQGRPDRDFQKLNFWYSPPAPKLYAKAFSNKCVVLHPQLVFLLKWSDFSDGTSDLLRKSEVSNER